MNKEWEDVRNFHVRFQHPYGEWPNQLELPRVRIRYKWMLEELNEFLEADNITE